jgi:hypothetical protein
LRQHFSPHQSEILILQVENEFVGPDRRKIRNLGHFTMGSHLSYQSFLKKT